MPSSWGILGRAVRVALLCLFAAACLTLLSAVPLSAPALAQTSVIKSIKVEGNRRVEPETVKSYLQVGVGDAYDAFKVDQSLKALFDTGLFADVNIELQGSTLVVTVTENPVINKVAFEGNSEVEDSTLATEVQLKPRSVFTRARVQADVQRILDVYQRQGLFAAQVEPKIIQLEENRVNLVFEINEGPSTKVKSINFVGNHAFSDTALKDVITTTEKSFFSFFKSTDIYDPDRLNLDRELLRQYYLKNGYADAQIISGTADLDPSGSGFFITFTIEEGDPYVFGAVTVESSLPGVDGPALLAENSTTTSGDTYDASAVDSTVEQMTLALAEAGNAFAQVRPRADRDPVNHTIGITYVVEEGPKVYIERINIVGNVRTEDYVIRREFRLAEGDAFNRLLVSRAKKRLQNLGFFKTVDVSADPGTAADRVILTVNVVEQSTGEISFGAGYSTSEGVIGDITFKERNLLGKGQFVQVKVGGSLERLQFDLNFTEPRFLDQNLAAGFDLFHREVDYSKESGYKSRRTGGDVRLGIPLNDSTYLTTRYTLAREEVYDVSSDSSQVSLAVQQAEGVDWVSSVGYTLAYDKRNSTSNPTKGIYLELAQDLAGAGGDVYYIRTVAEGRAYYPITEKVTFVARLVGGDIEGWNGQDVRLFDLFYKGGETIRGFERSGLGPRDLRTNDALGGKMFYAGTAEVRFPIPLIPDDLGLSAAVFADAGSLFGANDLAKQLSNEPVDPAKPGKGNKVDLFDSSAIRSSVGASLIWNSPLGPLRADYAFVLSKGENDKEQAFRFGASTQF